MDVAFMIDRQANYKPGYTTLKGTWINLGYMGKPWVLMQDKIQVKTSDLEQNWLDITNSFGKVRPI